MKQLVAIFMSAESPYRGAFMPVAEITKPEQVTLKEVS
ncbi:hypothetical protein X762_00990 [Mesorhizobium sp. LSHC426A00]|nr:hypothetical protein X762_00990 [Mesorhizobium sp. LSHC426A00]ESX59319.1 hypothetical protein X761_03820 [Mesorhizobium sp. LSHC424B00]ESX68688.1 hypothetical protein X758_21395 [Mesorhizobium sp. LSHC416B00]ESX97274.1 hypothetical protein X754_01050 [Mesorhizobium sp. LNJC403B00]ESY12502.1 hypothetical protein X752_12100 [Mesorhizobium sp. LNJC398B00]ESY33122.1 hypothetical protein X748_22450 [Mesorhizobium sp. LNJC386A00]